MPIIVYRRNTFPEDTLILNGGFERDTTTNSPWGTFSNGTLNKETIALNGARAGTYALRMYNDVGGTNVQLNQTGFALTENAWYRLRFSTKSSTSWYQYSSILQNNSPYALLGYEQGSTEQFTTWHDYDFTFQAFATETDSKLYFRLDTDLPNGEWWMIDRVALQAI